MKNICYLLIFALLLPISCKEESPGQYPVDGTPPSPLKNVQITSRFGGGVSIKYDIPDDKDLLYVVARYTLDTGSPMEIKTSMYETHLNIIGYSYEAEHDVELRTVDRSRNESEPVIIKVQPKESPIHNIFRSLEIYPDFGGIFVRWANEERSDITVMVSRPIAETSDLTDPVVNFYSNAASGSGNVRGFAADSQAFIVQIQDRWGNLTEEKKGKYLPKYEEECNKALFKRWNGDPDIPYNQYSGSWPVENLWDNVWNNGASANGFHTRSGAIPTPNKITFDLGAVFMLSRFKIMHRPATYAFNHGNPKRFKLYGSLTPYARMAYDDSDDPSVQDLKWQFIGEFDTAKPSGLPLGENSDEDIQVSVVEGIDYTCPAEFSKPLRYLRMDVQEIWAGQPDFIHMMEMSLWGEPQK
ncbi:MAG: DUF4959 domain-containing protein [Tannerella sp.]|jgi:hypothetical protein|nr:DUF4959 domain-containing protein [Tannerella sp.]